MMTGIGLAALENEGGLKNGLLAIELLLAGAIIVRNGDGGFNGFRTDGESGRLPR